MDSRFCRALLAAAVAALALAPAGAGAPADLDRGFNDDGKVIMAQLGAAVSLVGMPDGTLVGALNVGLRNGPSSSALFRLTSDGHLDASFGRSGFASFSDATSSGAPTVTEVVREPGGSLVALGGAPVRPRLALVRYLPDGTVDGSFGTGGRVETNALAPVDLAHTPGGGLVVAGEACAGSGEPRSCSLALMKLRANGTLDRAFGRSGFALLPFTNAPGAVSLAVYPDGRIAAVGAAPGGIALVRFRPDGTLDGTFGTGGVAPSRAPGLGAVGPRGLIVHRHGRLVVLARHPVTGDAWVLRYRGDGRLDRGFGVRGGARVVGVAPTALAQQGDGKLVIAGYGDLGTAFGVARLRANGGRDRTFGVRGVVLTDLDPGDNVEQRPFAVAVGPAPHITVAGGVGFPDYAPALVRYRGGPHGAAAARHPRYVIRVSHSRAAGGTGAFHRGDVMNVLLSDRQRRTAHYELCWTPAPVGRPACTQHHTVGAFAVSGVLPRAGTTKLRFRIEGTGQVLIRTVRVRRAR
ncbi:MAG: hypothetical protein QOI98_2446 [Solirubrobacteraceae bacterium]|nr:hypothetical protein [Solirubrobacteraceae bacterium]